MVKDKKKQLLDEYYSSDKNQRKNIVDSITQMIINTPQQITISPEELYLTIDEAITNAMEHGNKWDPSKKIHISINFNSYYITVTIEDEGNGFNIKKIETTLKNRNLLSARGRGIYIINQFCKLTWNTKGNKINMQFKLKE